MEILNKKVNVKNRSTAQVGYTLPDTGVRRTWMPNEIKKSILVSELEQATYIPGGKTILQDYLQINDEEACEFLGLEMEPEYFYTEAEILTLLSNGTIEQFLDCLDFAPEGVIDLIKNLAVKTNLNDISKRNAIKEKTGFDVSSVIANIEYANSKDDIDEENGVKKRRASVAINSDAKNVNSGRRSAPVVSTPVYTRAE